MLEAEFEKATKAGSLEDSKALQKEIEEFNGDEGKWKNPNIKTACKRYLSEKEVAQKKLSLEVDKLVRECVRKKEIEIAEKLKDLLIEYTSPWTGNYVLYDPNGKNNGFALYTVNKFFIYFSGGKLRQDYCGDIIKITNLNEFIDIKIHYMNGKRETHRLNNKNMHILVIESGWYLVRQ